MELCSSLKPPESDLDDTLEFSKFFMSDDSIWKFLWIGTLLEISKCQKSFFSHFFVTDAQKGPSFWMFYLLNLHFTIFFWDPRNWSSFWTLSWDVSTTENHQTCSVFRISNLGKQRVPPLRFAQNLTLDGLDDKNNIFQNLPLIYAFRFLMKSEPKSCLTQHLRRIQTASWVSLGAVRNLCHTVLELSGSRFSGGIMSYRGSK